MIEKLTNAAMSLVWWAMFLLMFPMIGLYSVYEWMEDRKREREWDRKYGEG
jgi:hypothetical protein